MGLTESAKPYFSNDEKEAYVLTDSQAKIRLMNDVSPSQAPLYINIEEREAIYPAEVEVQEAEEITREVAERLGIEEEFRVNQDSNRWEEEFSEFLDMELNLGSAKNDTVGNPTNDSPYRYL